MFAAAKKDDGRKRKTSTSSGGYKIEVDLTTHLVHAYPNVCAAVLLFKFDLSFPPHSYERLSGFEMSQAPYQKWVIWRHFHENISSKAQVNCKIKFKLSNWSSNSDQYHGFKKDKYQSILEQNLMCLCVHWPLLIDGVGSKTVIPSKCQVNQSLVIFVTSLTISVPRFEIVRAVATQTPKNHWAFAL